MSEADTCRKYVVPKLQAAGWDHDPHSIAEQRWFTDARILDYTGTATCNFAGPAFDGDPAFANHEEIDAAGWLTRTEVLTTEEPEVEKSVEAIAGGLADAPLSVSTRERDGVRCRKSYFDGGYTDVTTHLVYEIDTDGNQLRVIKLTDYFADKVRTLWASPDELRARWADVGQRADIIQQLAERGIDFATVAAQAGQPDADPFDLANAVDARCP